MMLCRGTRWRARADRLRHHRLTLPCDREVMAPGSGAATGVGVAVRPSSASDSYAAAGGARDAAGHEESSMTIPPDLEAKILRYYHVEKWRVGTIARQLRVHSGTVRRVLAQAGLPRSGAPARR